MMVPRHCSWKSLHASPSNQTPTCLQFFHGHMIMRLVLRLAYQVHTQRIRHWHTFTATVRVMQVHLAWIKTPRNKGGLGHIKIPLLADVKKVNPETHPQAVLLIAYAQILHAANIRL